MLLSTLSCPLGGHLLCPHEHGRPVALPLHVGQEGGLEGG